MSDQRTRGTETTSGPEGAHQGAGIPPAAAAVAETFPLGLHWPTVDPFLFVAHHRDDYPAGTEEMWMADSASARLAIGRAKLMMIGLATPTRAPLTGLKDGGANTGSPV